MFKIVFLKEKFLKNIFMLISKDNLVFKKQVL